MGKNSHPVVASNYISFVSETPQIMPVIKHVRLVKIHEGLMGFNPKQHCTEGSVTAGNLFLPCHLFFVVALCM